MPPPYMARFERMTLFKIRGAPSPLRMPPPPALDARVLLIASFATMKLLRIVGEETADNTPPPSQYVPAPCSSSQRVPRPPVRVNPASDAVESSRLIKSTQLAVSGCCGRLPLMMVLRMKDSSPFKTKRLATR